MKKHKLKNSSTDVSLLGFGCMKLPMKDGEIDITEVKKMVDYAYSKGVNYFDTAYPYHGGKSETIVRDIIKHYDRETFYLVDKSPLWECKKEEDIDRLFHEQLQKCGECLPKYPQQIEIPTSLLKIETYFRDNGIIE